MIMLNSSVFDSKEDDELVNALLEKMFSKLDTNKDGRFSKR